MQIQQITRLAPTPSGFLHAGNRLNFARTAQWAHDNGALLALRIDDVDSARYRREYVDDIFGTLHDMAIRWDIGPRDTNEFERRWSQRLKHDYYRHELRRAEAAGLATYACDCSRSTQVGPATGGCIGNCRARSLPAEAGRVAIRVHVPADTIVTINEECVDLAAELGDFVIWRRDDQPAYQLVSVIEDRDLGTTHVVRGMDLRPSTAAQIHVAPWFDALNLARATYEHHELMRDAHGRKLSKSTAARPPSREESP